MKNAAKLCPRWDSCSVNACPLDLHMACSSDAQPKCTIEKQVRTRIAKQVGGILRDGLSAREWAGQQREASLTSLERLERDNRLKTARAMLSPQS